MALATVILLGIILLVLIGILIIFSNFFSDIEENSKSINGNVYDCKNALQLISDEIITLSDEIKNIYHIAYDIKFQQENLEKHEIDKAIKSLESLEVNLMDLKDLHNTLLSIEQSVEIIIAHPAFTNHYDDGPLDLV